LAQAPAYEPVANVGQIMQMMIQPAAKALDTAASEAPKDQREWRMARNQATVLAEAAQLLTMANRPKDQDGWMKDAHVLFEGAMAASKAAQGQDLAAYQTAVKSVDASCQGCHGTYRTQGKKGPPKQ
jgi:cytochrome c556